MTDFTRFRRQLDELDDVAEIRRLYEERWEPVRPNRIRNEEVYDVLYERDDGRWQRREMPFGKICTEHDLEGGARIEAEEDIKRKGWCQINDGRVLSHLTGRVRICRRTTF